MKKWQLFIPLTIFLFLSALLYIGLFRENQGDLPSALIDKPFPSFRLSSVKDPERLLSEQALTGEVALVNVWATWCPACRVEHPYLNYLSGRGVAIYGVNYKDDQKEANIWLDRLEDPYRFSINDGVGSLGIDLGVYGAPETYLIDTQGIVRYKHIGIVDDNVWEKILEPIYRKYKKQNDQKSAGGKG